VGQVLKPGKYVSVVSVVAFVLVGSGTGVEAWEVRVCCCCCACASLLFPMYVRRTLSVCTLEVWAKDESTESETQVAVGLQTVMALPPERGLTEPPRGAVSVEAVER
jgi:hypothetical protein